MNTIELKLSNGVIGKWVVPKSQIGVLVRALEVILGPPDTSTTAFLEKKL
jgi:hypothetical protein